MQIVICDLWLSVVISPTKFLRKKAAVLSIYPSAQCF